MWSPSRRVQSTEFRVGRLCLIVLCTLYSTLLLSACGFQPLYGKHDRQSADGQAGAILQRIKVVASAGEPAQRALAEQFKRDLEDRLNPGNHPRSAGAQDYTLSVGIGAQEGALAVSKDGTISRYNVTISAGLTLTRPDGQTVFYTTARRVSSYNNVTGAFFSTYVSSQDAISRGVTDLAEDVRMRLAAFFTENPNPQPLNVAKLPRETAPGIYTSVPGAPQVPVYQPYGINSPTQDDRTTIWDRPAGSP